MRQRFARKLAFVGVLLFFVVGSPALLAAAIRATGAHVANEVLVKLRPASTSADLYAVEQQGDIDSDEQVATVAGGTIWRLHSRSKSSDQLLAALAFHPSVVFAEANGIWGLDLTPNDTSYSQLWGMKNTGQVINTVAGKPGADISAETAWGVTTGSRSIVIGVVDTGIDYNHTDLAANVWSNPGGIGGCAAGTHGFNGITKTCDPLDDHYHGTHVAGTIGAVGNNSLGVVGVNWVSSIMGLKFLNAQGSGTTADAISAIDFAVNAKISGVNVRVLSNSWGGGPFAQTLLDEINKANANDILFVAAAGNNGTNNDSSPHYPSNYNAPNVVSVAATDNNDLLASFSNYGATTVHLGAPGVDIFSLQPGNAYQYLSGTSMATPHVAGVAALVLAKTPGLTTAQLKSAIFNNVDPISSLTGKCTTGGRLNAAKAVGGAPAPCTPPATPTLLTASGGVGTATLNWSGAAPEYHVLRSNTTGGPYTQVGVSTSTSFIDSGLAAGTYFWVVRAFASCESPNSNQASATVTAPPPSPDFSLSVSPSSVSVRRTGGTATYTVTITPSGGFNSSVSLSVSGQPTTSTASFSPNPTTASSTMTIAVSSGTQRGTYPLTVTGTSGSLSRTASATLVITK